MAYTVGELRKDIEGLPDDMEIIIQKDAEGNAYSPARGADPEAVYVADTTWSGDVYDTSWSADDADMDEDDWVEILEKPGLMYQTHHGCGGPS